MFTILLNPDTCQFSKKILRFLVLINIGLTMGVNASEINEVPEPLYKVEVERHKIIEMRDGTKLATDIYRPIGVKSKLPAILIRTPYDRKYYRIPVWLDGPRSSPSSAYFFAGQGYMVAVQDVRGKFDSEGSFIPQAGDVDDGYDTVEWLAKQPWSNGKVGSIGCSYSGDTQILMAQAKPPHLKAMIPQAAGSVIGSADGRYRYFGVRIGGANALAAGTGWFHQAGSKVHLRYPDGIDKKTLLKMDALGNTLPGGEFPKGDFTNVWKVLPQTDIPKVLNSLPNDFNDVMFRDLTDPWWDQFQYLTDKSTFDVPALHINSWYDFGVNETILEWQMFQDNAVSKKSRDNQFMILSPTEHCASEIASTQNTIVGERELGDARFDYWNIYLKWFAYWLKGEKNAITDMPKVQYYMMGANEWRSSEVWPPQNTRFEKFYLHSNGQANSRQGDGVLLQAMPDSESFDHYTYDPAKPVPSRGGLMCCTGTKESVAGSFDQSDIEMRNDILVYTTQALKETVEVAGPIEVELYVSSSAKDTDFVAKLIDVYPDGRAFNIQEGILRARYREGLDKKVLMKEGEVYKLKISLQATANAFLAGHKIRLLVTSSNFPAWDRNLNTGGNNYDETEWVKANNVIHHGKKYPSHLVLPLMAK
jgi:putative CocE/NonD family hydrolase